MAGVPGRGGPPPKRGHQRRRHAQPAGGEAETGVGAAVVEVPEPDEDWHPLAVRWFRSLAESGQSVWYEPSDWATAQVLAELLTKALGAEKVSAALVERWQYGATELLTTEGARRRARLELERVGDGEDEGEAADVSQFDEWRRRLRSG